MKDRLEVRAQVIECERCDLYKACTAPVPFAGPTPAQVAVLGEAPGRTEDELGQPFVGKAGQLLRRVLSEVGFDPEEICWINTASCWPRREDGRGRAPSAAEVHACSVNREAQLDLADPAWIILTGNVPLQAFRPDLRIGKMRGRPFLRSEKVAYFPVYHPAAVLRNPAWETDLKADLSLLHQLVEEGTEAVISSAPLTCVRCGLGPEESDEFWHWDSQGIPYCDVHWRTHAPEGRS